MARIPTEQIKERLLSSRPRSPSVPFESSPVLLAPAQTSSKMSYEELRSLGRNLNAKEKFINSIEEKIAHVEANRERRRSEGKRDADTYQLDRLNSLKAQLALEVSEYNNVRNTLNGDTYSQAKASAPKYYNEERLRERNYDPNGERPEEQIAMKQRRSFVQARELAERTPGIYRYRSGGYFISQAGEGTFLNQQGQTVSVKIPIGRKLDGGFIYPTAPANNPATLKVVTGFNLFDPQTRTSLTNAAGDRRFNNAGSLFASAVPASFENKPAPSFSQKFDNFFNAPRNKYPALNFGYIYTDALQANAVRVRSYGSRLETEGRYPVTRTIGGLLAGASNQASETPIASGALFSTEVAASAGAGYLVKRGALWVAPRIASRIGITNTIVAFRTAQTTAGVVGTGAMVIDLSTSTPRQAGAKLVSYTAAGTGLTAGFSFGPSLMPNTVVTPSKYVRSRVFKIGETPGDFSAVVKTPVTISESAFGFSRTTQVMMKYNLVAKSGSNLMGGDVPVILKGTLRYNSLLKGPVSSPQSYDGIYRFGGFRVEPTILKTSQNGVTASMNVYRRPSDLMVLTRGRGPFRQTFVSEVMPNDFKTFEGGSVFDITAGFRTASFKGSRNPLLVDTNVGGIKLSGLLRKTPSVDFMYATDRMTFPFKTGVSRTASSVLESSPGNGVRFVRPEQTNSGFGLLERYGLFKRSRRPVEAFNDALFNPEQTKLFSGLYLEPPRRVTIGSDTRGGVLRGVNTKPSYLEAQPLISLQGLRPSVRSSLSFRSLTLRSPRLTQSSSSLLSLSQVRSTESLTSSMLRTSLVTLPSTTTRSLTRTSLTDLSIVTPRTVPGFPFVPGGRPTFGLKPPVAPLLLLPGLLGGGSGGSGFGSRRRYGLARTVYEVSTGQAGRKLVATPTGGFTGLEAFRSYGRKKKRRSRR